MNKYFQPFMLAIPSVAIFANVAVAQPQAPPDKIPVKLQIVISTYEGDRKVSSLPYTLLATANGSPVSIISSSNVPIPSSNGGGVSYTNLGTNLQCTVTTEAGSFKVAISFSDKTVLPNKTPAASATAPARNPDYATFHDVNYNSAISMKDGETKQLISAPDKVTSEILKIDVTLTLDPPKRAAIDLSVNHLKNGFGVLTVQSN
jgi:hypothetical protein